MMSPVFLSKIDDALKATNLSNNSGFTNRVKSYFATAKIGDWVYPGAFKRQTGIDIKNIYEFLIALQSYGYLRPYLEAYCPNCSKFTRFVYETIDEIEQCCDCDHCGESFEPKNHVVVIYKVVKDG